jgi:hypothetical protein
MSLYEIFAILEEWAPVDDKVEAPSIEEHEALARRFG